MTSRKFIWTLCLALTVFTVFSRSAYGARPNIVLVFIDDMGWGDFSCFGNEAAETRNIDRLAAEGIRFESFYVNSPICSPSRTAISTGQYPQRWRITSYLNNRKSNRERGVAQWLDPKAPMLARFLHDSGYATGHFGKWHMGGQRDVDDAPAITEYGFDTSLTNFEGMGPKLLPLTLKPGDMEPGRIWQGAERLGAGYRWMLRSKIPGGFGDAAWEFIDDSVEQEKPFYVNVWPDDVHSPFWPPVTKWGENKRELYLSVLEEMDRQLGKLFDRIRNDEALRNNTLILVCSDNGPEPGAGVAGPFRGFKTQLYEGGVRSPLVVWGPGLVEPRGAVNQESVFSAIDLPPTLLDIARAPAAPDVDFDGESLVGALLGRSNQSRERPLFFRRPPDRDAFYGDGDLPDLAIRKDRWKFLCEYDGGDPELYDLVDDPSESNNLIQERPKIARALAEEVLDWNQRMPQDNGAQLASDNQE